MRLTPAARLSTGILLFLGLVGCQWLPVSSGSPAADLSGTVDFGGGRHAQASFDQVADAATISLMETSGPTSTTIASTITRQGGLFSLSIPRFVPDPTKIYILEAIKGLYGNAVNKDAARVRTLIRYTDGSWTSLTNLVPGPINLGVGSTALCVMYGLRSGEATINPTELMGSIALGNAEALPLPAAADTFTPPASVAAVMTKQDFHTVSDLVGRAVQGDSDPISAVQYTLADGYFVKTAQDPFIDNLSSTAAGYGAPLVITGYRFDPVIANNTVYFGGPTGTVAAIDSSKPNSANVLYVTVPEGAPSGVVMVRNGTGLSNGIQFTVVPRIGGKLN